MLESSRRFKKTIRDDVESMGNISIDKITEILNGCTNRVTYQTYKTTMEKRWYELNGWNKESFSEIGWLFANMKNPSNKSKRIPRYITYDELNILIDNAGPRTKHYILFLSRTGMRLSEMINIRIKDIDILSDKIIINYKACKSGSLCSRDISTDFFYELMNIFNGKEYLFETRNGRQPTRSEVSESIGNISYRMLNKKYRAHALRHYWSNQKHKEGASPYEVSKMMGHKNTGSRYSNYVHC